MKKYLIALILIVIMLLLGCNNAKDVEVQMLKDEIEKLKSQSTTDITTNAVIESPNDENEPLLEDIEIFSQPEITTKPIITEPIVEEIITENPDVRNAKWGMTNNEVTETESTKIIVNISTHIMLYDTTLGFSTTGMYFFNDDRLYCFQYTFTQKHTNKTDFVNDYNKIKNALSELYSEPEEDRIIWKDDSFADKPADYGLAVSIGHLAYYSIWQTETTIIRLLLSGDNYNISLKLSYTDINYEEKTDTSGL